MNKRMRILVLLVLAMAVLCGPAPEKAYGAEYYNTNEYNVTVDVAALCLYSGNAAVLRGGSESFESNQALARCIQQGLAHAALPMDGVQPFTATVDDVVADLVNQNNVGLKAAQDQGVHGLRVLSDGVSNRGEVHAYIWESIDDGG